MSATKTMPKKGAKKSAKSPKVIKGAKKAKAPSVETAAVDAAPVHEPPSEALPTPKPTKATRTKPTSKPPQPAKPAAKLGVLSAAHQVLAGSETPMTCQEMIEAMAKEGLWSSPNGKTPAQTLYAAIIREIAKKGDESRFAKTERGKFTARAV